MPQLLPTKQNLSLPISGILFFCLRPPDKLILFSFQYGTKKRAWRTYLLFIPLLKALALPNPVE